MTPDHIAEVTPTVESPYPDRSPMFVPPVEPCGFHHSDADPKRPLPEIADAVVALCDNAGLMVDNARSILSDVKRITGFFASFVPVTNKPE